MSGCRLTVWCVTFCLWIACPGTVATLCAAVSEAAHDTVADSVLLLQAWQKTDSAQLLFGRNNYKAAQKLLKKSQQLALAANNKELLVKNYTILIAIDSAANDFRTAFKHQKLKETIQEEFYIAQKEKIEKAMREQYNTEEIQEQIAGLKVKIVETRQKTGQRTNIVTLLVALVCVILMAGIVQTYQYRQRKRSNEKLYGENEKNNQQLDLLIRKVEEYLDENQSLAQQNAVLEKSNMVKDKLLSVISHDLRSPMSSLQALLNLFNTNNIARRDLVDFFGKLLSRVENTSTMLENLLHWSEYQLSGLEPIFEKADIQRVIDDSINFYRMQAEQKHIVIDNSLKTSVQVLADVEMLKIILRNLISNALKFTYAGGIITIKALNKDNYVIVSIKDTGMGISPDNQAKMFAMANFTTPGTEKEKGTGLGLMLCKDFVEHNHGKIWLDSKVGVGTTFYFSIPLAEE